MRKKIIKKMTNLAILSALSIIFYQFLKFPLPFIFPSFLDVQFSNLPVILAGFVFGPVEACLVVLIRFIVKLPFSSTAFIGETADLIIGCLVGITASLIYKKFHTKRGGIMALIVSSAVWVVTAVIANAIFLLPWYIEQYGKGAVIGLLEVIPGLTGQNYLLYYIVFAVIPFNLLLATIVSLVTFFVYKRISFLYKEEIAERLQTKVNYDALVIGITVVGMDILILIGTLIWNKNVFIVSEKNSILDVSITIIGYLAVLIFGIYLIIVNQIKNKKIKQNQVNN